MKKLIIHLHSSRTGILSDRKLQKIEEKEKVGVLFLKVTGMTYAHVLHSYNGTMAVKL